MVSRSDGSESYRMSDFTSGEIEVAMDQGVRKGSRRNRRIDRSGSKR